MAKYVKKYIEIEAIIWDGNAKTLDDFIFGHPKVSWIPLNGRNTVIAITNCNGVRECRIGDYIVKTPTGCIYPLSPESFHMSYELSL